MNPSIPTEMKAAALDRFGGPEVLHVETLPVPHPKPDEILIRIEAAGIGIWDGYMRAGEFLRAGTFPRVLGIDGAGEVVATGDQVTRFKVGDRVYAWAPKGGFHAQYVAVKESNAGVLPKGVSAEEAGALSVDGITGLRGLEDQLELQPGERLVIFGASGGIGHLAVQLAKRLGAKVFAVASGKDGVELAKRLGADAAVDGKKDDVAKAARAFAPEGFDAGLVLANAPALKSALETMRGGGRIAYPNGVEPAPEAPKGVKALGYNGNPGPDAFEELNRLIAMGPFHVELGHVYRLEEAATAHRDLEKHHLGRFAFKVEA